MTILKATILKAGTFQTNRYRKAIPCAVKLQVLMNHAKSVLSEYSLEHGESCHSNALFPSSSAADLQFDHRPPLVERDYDTDAGDFIPPQNDPNYLEVLACSAHLERTTGRKEGAERTVTTKGSDLGNAKHTGDLASRDALHRAKIASKAGRFDEAATILATARIKNKHVRRKAKIPSRPFPQRAKQGGRP